MTYPASVSVPFQGDYIDMPQDKLFTSKWPKIAAAVEEDAAVLPTMATRVMKINRSNGANAERIILLTKKSVLVST